jgi:hypothetical protein
MPKLMSITTNQDRWVKGEGGMNSCSSENERDKIDTTVDSVTAVHFNGGSLEMEKQWLIYLLPNFKHLSLDVTYLPSSTSELVAIMTGKIERLDICEYLIDDFTATKYILFRNLEDLVK